MSSNRFREQENSVEGLRGAAGAFGTVAGAQLAATPFAKAQMGHMVQHSKRLEDPKTHAAVARKAERMGVKIENRPAASQGRYIGPAYSPERKTIYNSIAKGPDRTGRTPGILAHELGHAQVHKRMGSAMAPSIHASRIAALAAIPVGAYYHSKYRHDDPEKARKARNISMGVGAAGVGGTLAHEAAATYNAKRTLEKIPGANVKGNMRMLNRAFGTYAIAGGATIGGGAAWYGIRNYLDKKKQHQEMQKRAAFIKEGISTKTIGRMQQALKRQGSNQTPGQVFASRGMTPVRQTPAEHLFNARIPGANKIEMQRRALGPVVHNGNRAQAQKVNHMSRLQSQQAARVRQNHGVRPEAPRELDPRKAHMMNRR